MIRRRQSPFWLGSVALALALGAPPVGAQGSDPAPGDGSQVIIGLAVYEKIPVTSLGLEFASRTVERVRGVRVEALDPLTGAIVASDVTDTGGGFRLQVPDSGAWRVRVLARLASEDIAVADNTAGGAIWSVEGDARGGEVLLLRASDLEGAAGAFNILDVIRRANAFIRSLEEGLELPALTVFWSPLNTDDPDTLAGAYVGGTSFDPHLDVAVVLGDRQRDSDEFDDDVILHEYAHFLAARFSGDDSIGGPHSPGDVLDPRVAWSEGWANYFSALVGGDPVYRDSLGPGGSSVLEYDLESNSPGGEHPGYWSERSVHALLWDLTDTGQDSGDVIAIEPAAVWRAFRALADDSFVYLPLFLNELVGSGAIDSPALAQLARVHFLDYPTPGRDGVTPSFPKDVDGAIMTGEVDSWSSGRANLARSAHLYQFETGGGAVSLELSITGTGPARNPDANDLDLLLMDAGGELVRRSSSGGDGDTERILTFLPAGVYVVEVRSFFGTGLSGEREFNSAAYRLRIDRP